MRQPLKQNHIGRVNFLLIIPIHIVDAQLDEVENHNPTRALRISAGIGITFRLLERSQERVIGLLSGLIEIDPA